MRAFIGVLILLFGHSFQFAVAKSPVWRVTKGENFLFIGGTIHLLSENDYPLPKAFDTAFALSEELIFETDVDSTNSIATQMKFMPVMTFQDGRTLKSVLKPGTHKALQTFIRDRDLPAAMFEKFTPAGVNLTLLVLELQKLGISGTSGVEAHLNTRAKENNKSVAWLESIEEQISFLKRMNQLDADLLIMSTIADTDKLASEWPKLLTAWRTGDLEKLENLAITKMLKESPELYEFILAERNRDWLPEITNMLDTPEVEFVLVGALHLAGKDSVLKMLKEDGYAIDQLD